MGTPGCYCIVPLAMDHISHYASGQGTSIGNTPLTCPSCRSLKTRRSRRRSALDYLLSVTGVLPWRCEECEARFYARVVPMRNFFYAHCGICGNLELRRIAPEHVSGLSS